MKKITVSLFTVIMMLSMIFATSAFAIEAPGTTGVEYRGHIENKGNCPTDGSWIQGPTELGTKGQSLRLEGFWIQLNGEVPADSHIQYRVHVQNVGWMAPVQDGVFVGTQGQALQIEAIEIELVDNAGVALTEYSVVYSGHVQNLGDVGPYTNGQELGTDGRFLRLEAITVEIVKNSADLTAYEEALELVEDAVKADYTDASWSNLQDVMLENVVTEQDSQEIVDDAAEDITEAYDALVTLSDAAAVQVLVDNAKSAITELTDGVATSTQDNFDILVATAETAIAALPADYKTTPEDTATLAETLQATVDNLVASNEEYVNKVAPVLNAENAIDMKNALVAAGVIRIDDYNINAYNFWSAGYDIETVADLQVLIDLTNANEYIIYGDLTDQAKIDKAQELLDISPADPRYDEVIVLLQTEIDNAQTELTAANEAAANLAAAPTAVNDLFTDDKAALAIGAGQDAIDAAIAGLSE